MRKLVIFYHYYYSAHRNECYFVSEVKSLSCFPVSFSEQLMKAEEKGSGAVAWPVYKAYIKAAGGPVVFVINALFFLSTTGSIAFSNWWLSYWIRQGSGVSWEKIPLQCNGRHLFSVCSAPKKKNNYFASVSCGSRLSINLNVHD